MAVYPESPGHNPAKPTTPTLFEEISAHGANRKPKPTGLIEGERRKTQAHAVLEARREDYLLLARRALLGAMLADAAGVASAAAWEDIPAPAGADPRCGGAVPGPLARAGIIIADGIEKNTRPTSHASYRRRWRMKDRAAAEAWLARHPEPAAVELADGGGEAAG